MKKSICMCVLLLFGLAMTGFAEDPMRAVNATANVQRNGGFETTTGSGSNKKPTEWMNYDFRAYSSSGGMFKSSSAKKHGGTYSAYVYQLISSKFPTFKKAGIQQDFSITFVKAAVSAWIYSEKTNNDIEVAIYDSYYRSIDGRTIDSFVVSKKKRVTSKETWTQISVSAAELDATNHKFLGHTTVKFLSTTSPFYIDDVTVTATKTVPLYAGLRASDYGFPSGTPQPSWLENACKKMAGRFDSSTKPCVIWIASTYDDATTDSYLTYFDTHGIMAFLQVEPDNDDNGGTNVPALIDYYLGKFAAHSCVIGFGVDVEWFHCSEDENSPDFNGRAVTDAQAKSWVDKVKSYNSANSDYILFLKHWLTYKMPPTYRSGIMFLNDSQEFPNLNYYINGWPMNFSPDDYGFRQWSQYFFPAATGIQMGYETDKPWWDDFSDPPKSVGRACLDAVQNCKYLFWVDFTAEDIVW